MEATPIINNEIAQENSFSRSLIETGFTNAAEQRELADKIIFNPDAVVSEMKDAIKAVSGTSDVIFFGVDHSSVISHEKVAEFLSAIPETQEKCLVVEYSPTIQEELDEFLITGKLDVSDNSELYSEIYTYFKTEGHFDLLPEYLQGTFFDKCPQLIQVLPILNKARELGLSLVAGDRFHDAGDDMDIKRDAGMFDYIKASKEKYKQAIVVAGGNHVQNSKREIETGSNLLGNKKVEETPSVAQLSKQYWGGDRVKAFLLENQLHNKKYSEPDEAVSSILFDAMKKFTNDGTNVGLRITDNSIRNNQDVTKLIPVDYYVPVYSLDK